jgi:hypothetical protein
MSNVRGYTEIYQINKKKILDSLSKYKELYYEKLLAYKALNPDKEDNEYTRLSEINLGLDIFLYFTREDLINIPEEDRLKMVNLKSSKFVKRHTVVSDYMISKGVFSEISYIKYINRLYNEDLRTKDKNHYYKTQASYYRYLASEIMKNLSNHEIKKREKEIADDLINKSGNQEEFVQKIKREYEENSKINMSNRREEFNKAILKDYKRKD